MKNFSFFINPLAFGIVLLLASNRASADPLRDYLWTNRVLVTFSAHESIPERLLLLRQIEQYKCEFRKRDLVHIDLIAGSVDYQSLGQRFPVSDKDFKIFLLGKDGKTRLYTDKAALQDIFVLIDTRPIRKKEMLVEKCL
jgi:hypothetical protein